MFSLCLPDQELCIKQPLHRKKLQLALQALGSEEDDLKGRLDSNWVTSESSSYLIRTTTFPHDFQFRLNTLMFISGWLDDIGLPQYKSHFDEARVDGRVLHYMTVVSLKPSCCLCGNLQNLFDNKVIVFGQKVFLINVLYSD